MGTTRTANGAGPGVLTPIGDSGLEHHNGFMQDDFLQALKGIKKYKTFNEMRLNSPIIGAAMSAIKYPVRKIDWFYTSDQGDDDPRLELLNKARDNMRQDWGSHLFEALTMLDFGFAPCAIQYRREGSEILWDRFMMLGQDTIMRWLFDDGEIAGVMQWPHVYPAPIPVERLLLYRINVERNNPEGRSMLRQSYTSYYYTKELTKIEAIGKERGMAGLPVITLPPGATTDESDTTSDASKAAKIVRNIRMDEQAGIVLPTVGDTPWDIKLLTTGVNSELAMNTVVQRHESRMLMSMLSQFIMLGMNSVGTQSKAESDIDFFNLILDAIADVIADAHNRQAIPRLLQLNGMDTEGVRLEHSPAGDIDLSSYADFLSKTANLITWTADDEAMLRSIARLPEKTPEELAELQLEKQQRAMEIQRQMRPAPGQRDDDEEEDDRFAARLPTAGVADNAPDDDDRRRHERIWYREASNYFNGALARVMKGARQIDR